jgi:hypothetical protein
MSEKQGAGQLDPLIGLACGRVLLGVWALTSPTCLDRVFGMAAQPELAYMTRIFGARAIALGSGYLAETPSGRRRWHRLALCVDTSDTITAISHLLRRDVPARSARALAAVTGGYMIVGAARLRGRP